jgi:coniferyl-aldehyde dehydrogenase
MTRDGSGEGVGMEQRIRELLDRQRVAFRADGFPRLEIRIDRLDRLTAMLLAHEGEIVETLFQDFGGRSHHATRAGDIVGGINAIGYNRDNVAKWMEPISILLPPAMEAAGARAELRYHPLGVIGAVIPWNGPVLMSCLAAAGAFAAGNRLMLKTPEATPLTSALIARMFASHFDETEAAVIEGGPDVGSSFTRQAFDHLLFTGSSVIARKVMRAAADNLVPVTLELGGKNPVIAGRTADPMLVANRVVSGKLASSGQVCVSPDYLFVPKGMRDVFAEATIAAADRLYPTLLGNDDYTAIIDDRHFSRLCNLLDDARAKGARLFHAATLDPQEGRSTRKFPFCVVLDPSEDAVMMHEEIFGPILPILEYERLEDALDYIGRRPHPLSGYYFGSDPDEQAVVIEGLRAGNMVVNDVRCQLYFEQLPFGGVGESGMGRYRGYAGFQSFSNAKTVIHQTLHEDVFAAQRPPYSDATRTRTIDQIAAMKG